MPPPLRRLVLFAYLGVQVFYLVVLTVLMFGGRIGEAIFLAQSGLVINGLAALLIRPDTTTEAAAAKGDVEVTSKTTTVTETQPAGAPAPVELPPIED